MSAKLTLVKKIVDEGVINSYHLILNVLFGGKLPGLYDENKVYNKGDIVLVLEDGVYKLYTIIKDGVTGPFDKNNAKEIIFTDLFKDSSLLTQFNKDIISKNEAMVDDISTIITELAGLMDNKISLKTLYRENFKTSEGLKIANGMFIPGCIKAVPGTGIEFELNEPIELSIKPSSFKIKHYIELLGLPTLGCSITFNALDAEPYWFSANDAILENGFFEIPISNFVKDEDVPYALNIRIFGNCDSDSDITISDLMVVFI